MFVKIYWNSPNMLPIVYLVLIAIQVMGTGGKFSANPVLTGRGET